MRWGAIALLAIVALVAWLATRGGSDPSEPAPRYLSKAELIEAAKNASPPIYWAGPALNAEYGLLDIEGGHRVLYVPAEQQSEGATTKALTVGSYPLADPEAAIQALAKRPGAIVRHGTGNRIVVTSRDNPSSVYFAGSEGSVEVEVYAPEPQRAMRLALAGRVRPVR